VEGGGSLILNPNSQLPIYIQIAEWLENEILSDQLVAEGKVYSQYQLAEMFNINPATAGKGLTILLENGTLYKKRGLGMFVVEGAKSKILEARKTNMLTQLIEEVVKEARRLAVSDEELIDLIKKVQQKG